MKVPEVDIHEVALSYEKQDVGMKRIDVKGAHIDVALEPDGSISLMRLFGEESSGGALAAAAGLSVAAIVGGIPGTERRAGQVRTSGGFMPIRFS